MINRLKVSCASTAIAVLFVLLLKNSSVFLLVKAFVAEVEGVFHRVEVKFLNPEMFIVTAKSFPFREGVVFSQCQGVN